MPHIGKCVCWGRGRGGLIPGCQKGPTFGEGEGDSRPFAKARTSREGEGRGLEGECSWEGLGRWVREGIREGLGRGYALEREWGREGLGKREH